MAFTYLAFCYVLALLFTAVLIFLAIWHVIAFDELKNDHKNPIEQCNVLNPLVLPEYLLHLFLVVLILFGGDFFTVIFNLPLIIFHVKKYATRPTFSRYAIYDPTSIMNGDILNANTKEGWAKLGFYMITFFYYLYCFISQLIA